MRYDRDQFIELNPLWVIILLNLIVVIASTINSNVEPFLGLTPRYFASQPWTLFTAMFVHAGLTHFLLNMFTLYFFGNFLSKLVGWTWFTVIYLIGGVVGNLFFLLIGLPYATVVGASGAIFAVSGALVMLTPKLRVMVFPIPAQIPLWAAVLGGFLLLSLVPGIAWQAHLGGLAVGIVAGYFLKKRQRSSGWPRF